MKELWKTHPKFTNYSISNQGQVKRIASRKGTRIGSISKQFKNKYGYMIVGCCQNGEQFMGLRVHQLVLQTFIGPKPSNNHCCNHKNGKTHIDRAAMKGELNGTQFNNSAGHRAGRKT